MHGRLSLFNLEINVVHFAGIMHQSADTLTGRKETQKDQMPIDNDIAVLIISPLTPLYSKSFGASLHEA